MMANDGLPPLQATPNLDRLLVPGEEVIYTARLHPLYGFPWLLGGLALFAAGWLWSWFWLLAIIPLVIYYLPFYHFELAVTTQRLLLRQGRFGVMTEGTLAEKLEDWHVNQHLFQALLHAGTMTLRIEENRSLRLLTIPWLRNPMSFIEALETLQMPLLTDDNTRTQA